MGTTALARVTVAATLAGAGGTRIVGDRHFEDTASLEAQLGVG